MKLLLLRKMLLLLAVMLLVGLAAALRLGAGDPRPGPEHLVLAPDAPDFGRVAIGGSAERRFIARNSGTQPLVVANELAVPLRGVGYGPPEIDVTPSTLSFGEVGLGSIATGLVTIRNGGDEELRLAIQDARPFTAEATAGSVPPGGELDVAVVFAPEGVGRQEASLSIQSNDPARERVQVHLRGVGSHVSPDSRIETSANALDFGAASACETRERPVRITNRGTDPLSIASVTAAAPFFARGASRRLGPGGSVELAVAFSPREAGGALGRLLIHSNDPRSGVVSVSLRGEGLGPCPSESSKVARTDPGIRTGYRPGVASGGALPPAPIDSADAEPQPQSEAQRQAEAGFEKTPAAPPPPVREGSRLRLGSHSSEITPAHVQSVNLDPASGLLSLGGLELPVVEFPFGEYFEFAATGGLGRVTELGEAEVVIPLEIVDRYGEPTRLEVALTTGTARTFSRGSVVTRAGEPLGEEGDATLVGLATFRSGRLRGFTMEIVLNVHVQR